MTVERTVTYQVGRDILVTRTSESERERACDSEEDKGREDEEIV